MEFKDVGTINGYKINQSLAKRSCRDSFPPNYNK